MIKSFEQLRQKRLGWVASNKENRFDTGIKRLLTDLYPDNAHFIYELLQNAEDAGATKVCFILSEDSIEFEHNGSKLFTLNDVEAITSIGESTKQEDPTSIGKFGVGFKAVFAYTTTPEIHSGTFHFRIQDLVVPSSSGVSKRYECGSKTLFVLPFNHPDKAPSVASAEIIRALRNLGDNTLLFLKHIRLIEYMLPDGSTGRIERFEHEDNRIEISLDHPHGEKSNSHWLRVQNQVQIKDEDDRYKLCHIAVAYLLRSKPESNNSKKDQMMEIVPVNPGQVSIYFPAVKETSNLRFHIHAPFASTVARDSVRDCEANNSLRDSIIELIISSLHDIRDRGLLTVQFLSVLPIPEDNLSEFYEPIRESIVNAFWQENLVPTRSGEYAAACYLYTGPASIANLLGDEGISFLTEYEPPLWAANARQLNQRDAKFIESLEMDEFEWSHLVEALNYWEDYIEVDLADEHNASIEEWITSKDSAWLLRFYAVLNEALDHDEYVDFGPLKVVRVIKGDSYGHVAAAEAFFPPEGNLEIPDNLNIVLPDVYAKGQSQRQKAAAKSFLQYLGVRVYDEEAVIDMRLDAYDGDLKISQTQHISDIRQFVQYWRKTKELNHKFHTAQWLYCQNEDGSREWSAPSRIYIDKPFEETGLENLEDVHLLGRLFSGYEKLLSKKMLADFLSFIKELGAMSGLNIVKVSTDNNLFRNELWKDWQTRSTRWTSTAVDEDYLIEELYLYVDLEDVAASRLIWRALVSANPKVAIARFRPNKRYSVREAPSQLVCTLKKNAWIPTRNGEFKRPEDVTQQDLLSDFEFDDGNGLLTAIGFGDREKKESEDYRSRVAYAESLGLDSPEELEEIAALLREHKVSIIEIKKLLIEKNPTELAKDTVPNPERRRQRVLEESKSASERQTQIKERSVEAGSANILEAKGYLRAKYTNEDGELRCQCCLLVMPFQIAGEYYFEAVQCIKGLKKHYQSNRLALCPICAAKYQHARGTSDEELFEEIMEKEEDIGSEGGYIKVVLAEEDDFLFFVQSHWFDLRTVLELE